MTSCLARGAAIGEGCSSRAVGRDDRAQEEPGARYGRFCLLCGSRLSTTASGDLACRRCRWTPSGWEVRDLQTGEVVAIGDRRRVTLEDRLARTLAEMAQVSAFDLGAGFRVAVPRPRRRGAE